MSAHLQVREEAILRPLKRHFEDRGFEFFAHPSREMVPSFLGSYRPDAIAYDHAGGGVVIEVKARPDSSSEPKLSALAKLFQEQSGWTFQVVYDDAGRDAARTYSPAGPDLIREALADLEALVSSGSPRAAFLYGWSVLEAVARELDGTDRPPVPWRTLIEWLTNEGFLSQDAAGRLRGLLPLRTAVAHGDFASEVGPDEIVSLLGCVRALASMLDVGRAEGGDR